MMQLIETASSYMLTYLDAKFVDLVVLLLEDATTGLFDLLVNRLLAVLQLGVVVLVHLMKLPFKVLQEALKEIEGL